MLSVTISTDKLGGCNNECPFKKVNRCFLFTEDTKYIKDAGGYFRRCPSEKCPLYGTKEKSLTYILTPQNEVLS